MTKDRTKVDFGFPFKNSVGYGEEETKADLANGLGLKWLIRHSRRPTA